MRPGINPKAKTWSFWAKALTPLLLLAVAGGLFSTRYAIGISAESTQSMRHFMFLIDKHDTTVKCGEAAVFRIPAGLVKFKKGEKFVKRMVGCPGDLVTVGRMATHVNGHWAAGPLDLIPVLGNDPQRFERTFTLKPGQYFAVGELSQSYDSRYWGVVTADEIVGRAYGIW